MKFKIFVLLSLVSSFCIVAANANWEYYAPGGSYNDDGGRFTMSLRGGMALGTGKVKNDLGWLVPEPYWIDDIDNPIIGVMSESYCGGAANCLLLGYEPLGKVDIAQLGAAKKFSSFSWAGGAAIGWVLSGSPQWRLEAAWDHISESDYNVSPMFEGTLQSTMGYELEIESTGVQSTVTTDIISAMFYYDFFDGMQKPLREFIPYVGFGFGYADSRTVLNLTDLSGDLSGQDAMQDFGEDNGGAALDFYTSKTSTNNVALLGAVGFSYGIADNVFIDGGIRLSWIPKIQWALNNELADSPLGVRSKDIFSAHNVIYGAATIGVRFEF